MKVLIVGSGGREHVLAWKIKESPLVKELYVAPGNGGTVELAENVDIKADDVKGLLKFAKKNKIDLTVVGPEAPLVNGIVDAFTKEKMMIFGPSQEAAQLEGSKVFAKEFMHRCNIPTAQFAQFDNIDDARDFLNKAQFPLVVKADGLAAGKGVLICEDFEKGKEALNQIMEEKIFDEAGDKVIIEECLVGEEVSILAISDGHNYVILDSSQDHKRIFDDDLGPNTGGMGAYSPAPIINEESINKIQARIIDPAIRGMIREGYPFRGVLYAGLMMTAQGPMVLEFNVRFGDPEAQAVLPRLQTDLVEIILAACEGRLNQVRLDWDPRACVCVVMSSGGYPGEYKKGVEIKGLEKVRTDSDTYVFHAGTENSKNKILTSGGRVLSVSSLGNGIEATIEKVYKSVEKIEFEGRFFRRDIGIKALKHVDRDSKATPARGER